jgi:hypothetical protein
LMWIRIPLFTLMWIRIPPFTLMWIRIRHSTLIRIRKDPRPSDANVRPLSTDHTSSRIHRSLTGGWSQLRHRVCRTSTPVMDLCIRLQLHFWVSKPPMWTSTAMHGSIFWSGSWARIFKLLRSPEIDSKESISPAYVALAGRYGNPLPTRFLSPKDYLKMPALILLLEIIRVQIRNTDDK